MKKFIKVFNKRLLWDFRYFFFGWSIAGVFSSITSYQNKEMDVYELLINAGAAIIIFLLPLAFGEKEDKRSGN